MGEPVRIGVLLPSVLENLAARATTEEPVVLEWQTGPSPIPSEGVAEGSCAWHGCGWRHFIGTGLDHESTIEATRALATHVADCPGPVKAAGGGRRKTATT